MIRPRYAWISLCFLFVWGLLAGARAEEPWKADWEKAVQAANRHDFRQAIQLAEQSRSRGLKHPQLNYYLGRWEFRAGNAKASLRRFERYLQSVPGRKNSLWERGISCYYAGEFRAGAKQFEDYQKFHNNDVENAVWRYLCQRRVRGKEVARQEMLPIKDDRRVPMMEIYGLFKGEQEPSNVLRALSASTSSEQAAKQEAMHAHLYLGLYFQSEGELEKSLDHIRKAVAQFESGDYMWSVAVVHEQVMQKERSKVRASEPGSCPQGETASGE